MKDQYKEIFEGLVDAYYNGDFEDTIKYIIENKFNDKKEAQRVIANLCGVEVDFEEKDFIYNLKKAITMHSVKKDIVSKIQKCGNECTKDGGEAKCVSACPFDAILVNPIDNNKYIDYDICLSCGECVKACDSGKYMDAVQFLPIAEILKSGKKVIAAVAPAISGQFGEDVNLDMLRESFIKAGFTDMIEVAFAADMLSIKESVEFDKHVNNEEDLLITSCCCPMWVGMLKKVYSDLVKHVSPSVSPMIAMARVLKQLSPDIKVVFIGPCIAKKSEAKDKDLVGDVDYVLTFQELKVIFDALSIEPAQMKGIPALEYASRGGRLYARTGGVSEAIGDIVKELYPEKYKYFKAVQANGVPECRELLKKAQNGEIDATFLEGMGCVGGCVGGPKKLIDKEKGKEAVDKAAYKSPVKVATHSHVMDEVLGRIGITSLKDFEDPKKIEIFERNF
ncbi:[Fe-Fe] hydrogenase large subunit C-terminal domain-containing protein [Clostridium vincentii]|uniref:Iron hydrogenase 1 n=1 Tax=Clostridium vincentii TaxID=52704 RepID=A0A2T0BII0_9CLOT|nr:[Fe-Fe] hydrogenase large subunit C-terminal domain-containing protein [Clostridium vincentii]PRR83653.1 Iron hydrogenase 1 [Clostridium vincentii]